MKYTATVDAVQLKKEDEVFEGQPVKGFYFTGEGEEKEKVFETDVFVSLPYQGGELKINEGQWVVSYPDEVKEVYSDDVFKEAFAPVEVVAEEAPVVVE